MYIFPKTSKKFLVLEVTFFSSSCEISFFLYPLYSRISMFRQIKLKVSVTHFTLDVQLFPVFTFRRLRN